MLGAHKAGREHVGRVHRLVVGEVIGDRCKVGLRLVDEEVLGHVPILLGGELVTSQHALALAGESTLTVGAVKARGDGAEGDAVAFGEAFDRFAQSVDDADRFAPQRAVGIDRNGTLDGVYI
jgi:hypothetical protein